MGLLVSRWKALPKLIRFVAVNSLIGIVIGWLIVAALSGSTSVASATGSIMRKTRWQSYFLLAGSFGATFGFAYLTTSVLLLPTDKDDFDKV